MGSTCCRQGIALRRSQRHRRHHHHHLQRIYNQKAKEGNLRYLQRMLCSVTGAGAVNVHLIQASDVHTKVATTNALTTRASIMYGVCLFRIFSFDFYIKFSFFSIFSKKNGKYFCRGLSRSIAAHPLPSFTPPSSLPPALLFARTTLQEDAIKHSNTTSCSSNLPVTTKSISVTCVMVGLGEGLVLRLCVMVGLGGGCAMLGTTLPLYKYGVHNPAFM